MTDTTIIGYKPITDFVPQVTKVLYVDKNRTDEYTPDGSILKPYLTIGAAVTAASANTVIYIASGSYSENVTLGAVIGLIGQSISEYSTNSCEIVGNVTVSSNYNSYIKNIKITGTLQASTGINIFEDLYISASSTYALNTGMGSTVYLRNSSLYASGDTSTIRAYGALIQIENSEISNSSASTVTISVESGGYLYVKNSFVKNNSNGESINLTASGSSSAVPNIISNVIARGNIVGSDKYTVAENTHFVSSGTLTGSNLILNAASIIDNDSSVTGTTVKDALETLEAAIPTYTEGYGIEISGTEISVDNTEFASVPTGWADEKILKTTDTEGIFEFIDVPTGTLGGSTGSTDNAILRANGEGGVTLQNSLVTIDDDGSINIPSGQSYKINNTALTASDVGAVPNSLFDGNCIIASVVDNTPTAVNIDESEIVGRLPAGNINGFTVSDLTEEETPASGDFLLGWESSGAIRKFDIGDLPGGSGDITTDSAWAAAGDLIVGTGDDTASILSKGTEGQYLRSGPTTVEWTSVAFASATVVTHEDETLYLTLAYDKTQVAEIPDGWADDKILKTTGTDGVFEFVNAPSTTNEIFLSLAGGWDSTTNPAGGFLTTETSTNKVNFRGTKFSVESSDKYHEFGFVAPIDFATNSKITAIPYIYSASTDASDHTIILGLQGVSYADGDTADDTAYGTAQTSTETVSSSIAGKVIKMAATSEITIAGEPSAGDWIQLRMYRESEDTYNADITVLGWMVTYTRS